MFQHKKAIMNMSFWYIYVYVQIWYRCNWNTLKECYDRAYTYANMNFLKNMVIKVIKECGLAGSICSKFYFQQLSQFKKLIIYLSNRPIIKHVKYHFTPQTNFYTQFDLKPKQIKEFGCDLTYEGSVNAYQLLKENFIPPLHEFCQIRKLSTIQLCKLPNIVRLQRKDTEQIVVVGDLHSCFDVLSNIFEGNPHQNINRVGFPSEAANGKKNVFIFNGDLVDRGLSGYQIVYILSHFLLSTHNAVFINRGNHESVNISLKQQNSVNFLSEIKKKFKQESLTEFFETMTEFYCALPVCTLIEGEASTLVVHGGVPLQSSLEEDIQQNEGVEEEEQHEDERKSKLDDIQQPFQLSQLTRIDRFSTRDLDEFPTTNKTLWHQFMWNYDRSSQTARFLIANNIKTLVLSHSASKFHNISLFNSSGQMKCKLTDEYTFTRFKQVQTVQTVQAQFAEVVEVFSSPTNSGEQFCCVVCGGSCAIEYQYVRVGEWAALCGWQ